MNRFQDNCFLVDNGLIEQMTTCPWKVYAAQIRQRRTAGESSALRFGRHIHTVLAYRNRMEFYKAKWKEEMQVKILENRFTKTPLEDEGWRNLDSAVKIIKGYNRDKTMTANSGCIEPHKITGLPLVEPPFA